MRVPVEWYSAGVGSLAMIALVSAGCSPDSWIRQASAMGQCEECSIEMREIWSSLPEDPNVFAVNIFLESGRWLWTMGDFSGHVIVRYDLRDRTSFRIDRFGDGPGEFRQIMSGLVDRTGDTLVVTGRGRVSLLRISRDLQHVRSFSSPVPIKPRSLVEATNGDFVVSSVVRQPSGSPALLHRITREGELRASFGSRDVGEVGEWRPLTASQACECVWALASGDEGFSVTLWDLEAMKLVRTLSFRPGWWYTSRKTAFEREREARSPGQERDPPNTGVYELLEQEGTLWVVGRHADRRWEEGLILGAEEEGWNPGLIFDSFILAIDAATGEVIATEVIDPFAYGFSSRGRLATYELERDGHPRLRLHQLSLER